MHDDHPPLHAGSLAQQALGPDEQDDQEYQEREHLRQLRAGKDAGGGLHDADDQAAQQGAGKAYGIDEESYTKEEVLKKAPTVGYALKMGRMMAPATPTMATPTQKVRA